MNTPPTSTYALARPAPFHLLLCSALVLYVYRFFVVGANLSLFRVVLGGWTLVAFVDLLRGRPRLTRWHAAFAGIAAAIAAVDAVEFTRLAGQPALRRDIFNHLLNVWFAGLLVLHLRSHAAVISLFVAFVWSSVLTSAITLASWALGALPFEDWLRAHGGPAARGLRYTGYDFFFHRATSAFYDPNFYGIYSALVVLTALGLWLTVERRRWLLWLAAVNVFFLGATLSRTGVAALIGTLVLALFVPWRGVRSARRVLALTAAATCVCFLAATVIQSRVQRARLATWWAGETSVAPAATPPATAPAPAPPTTPPADAPAPGTALPPPPTPAPAPPVAAPAITVPPVTAPPATPPPAPPASAPDPVPAPTFTPPEHERLAGSISLTDRLRRIRHGWQVFLSAPWLGRGGAALLHPDFPPHASAHIVYLTLLARYGIAGALVHAAFLLVPLVVLARRRGPPADRLLLLAATCLGLVFWSYDVLLSFELVYLFIGIAWGLAGIRVAPAVTAGSRVAAPDARTPVAAAP